MSRRCGLKDVAIKNSTTKRSDFVAGLIRDGYLTADFDQRTERSDKAKTADEIASIRLLSGYNAEKSDNFPFPEPFSDEENEMRAALARTIREQMKGLSAELLALAIDPSTPSKLAGMRPTRMIHFERQGRQSTVFIDQLVVQFIRKMRARETKPNVPLKSYVMAAVQEFGLGRSRVYAIWKAHDLKIENARTTFQEKLALDYMLARFKAAPDRIEEIVIFTENNFDIERGRARVIWEQSQESAR
jgi:hypothetical protein